MTNVSEARRPCMLIADDNYFDRIVMGAYAEALDWSSTVVEDGVAAVAVAQKLDFDILVFDQEMPALKGLEAIAAIRSGGGRNATKPAMIWTSDDTRRLEQDAMAIADVMVFRKPLSYNDFCAWVEGVTNPDTTQDVATGS